MAVQIVKVRNKRGKVIKKHCVTDKTVCSYEDTDQCFGCQMYTGNPDLPVRFTFPHK